MSGGLIQSGCAGFDGPETMKMGGQITGHKILDMVDSGAS